MTRVGDVGDGVLPCHLELIGDEWRKESQLEAYTQDETRDQERTMLSQILQNRSSIKIQKKKSPYYMHYA